MKLEIILDNNYKIIMYIILYDLEVEKYSITIYSIRKFKKKTKFSKNSNVETNAFIMKGKYNSG